LFTVHVSASSSQVRTQFEPCRAMIAFFEIPRFPTHRKSRSAFPPNCTALMMMQMRSPWTGVPFLDFSGDLLPCQSTISLFPLGPVYNYRLPVPPDSIQRRVDLTLFPLPGMGGSHHTALTEGPHFMFYSQFSAQQLPSGLVCHHRRTAPFFLFIGVSLSPMPFELSGFSFAIHRRRQVLFIRTFSHDRKVVRSSSLFPSPFPPTFFFF